jgi:MerR family transcriptional regulator, light-induced transcriptional regulator
MTDLREQSERPHPGSQPRSYRVERASIGEFEPAYRRHAAQKLLGLTRTIETRVIPSLVVAHATPQELHSDLALPRSDSIAEEVTLLAEQMIAGDIERPCARIETLRGQGHSLETIYLQLLAPAAIHLRRLWNSDLCGFAEATLALWRLQQLLRQYSVEFRAEAERQETGLRVLLAPTPREKYDLSYAMFALVLMSEFFRRDGWEAWIEPDSTSREFARVVHDEWFDVVEFLVSGEKQLDALASRIRMIRRESPNRSIGIMVHGQVFIEHPELVLLVGADLTATDARQGALQAQHLIGLSDRS